MGRAAGERAHQEIRYRSYDPTCPRPVPKKRSRGTNVAVEGSLANGQTEPTTAPVTWKAAPSAPRDASRSAAMLIVVGAVVPGVFVVIPMVIAIIFTFAVIITRSKAAARHNHHQSQQ